MSWKQIDPTTPRPAPHPIAEGQPSPHIFLQTAIEKSFTGSAQTATIYPDHWWDAEFWAEVSHAGPYRDKIAAIKLPKVPDAAATKAELKLLMDYQASPEHEVRRREIIEEADAPPAFYRRSLFLETGRRPLSRAFLGAVVHWSLPFIMALKHQYKRPRPTQLEPRLKPMVDCPLHPAYPSGHSTQSHLIALVFGEVSGRADVKQALLDAAKRIAENREYAGLHYPSDSEAGKQLATQLLPLFVAEFGNEIVRARQNEWS